EIARRLNSQTTPMRLSHDARESVRAENVSAWVQQRPDGEYELRVAFDVEEEGWARYEAERDTLGGPGGLSFTLTALIGALKNGPEPRPMSVIVAADAHHFPDESIMAAAEEFANTGSVQACRLYQFSAVPTAAVLIQFILQEGMQVPAGILSAWLYDALRHFW